MYFGKAQLSYENTYLDTNHSSPVFINCDNLTTKTVHKDEEMISSDFRINEDEENNDFEEEMEGAGSGESSGSINEEDRRTRKNSRGSSSSRETSVWQ